MLLSLVPAGPVSKLRRIIGRVLLLAAALGLAGCSMVRVAYDQAPKLGFWWIDGYLDFDEAQSARVHEAIERWFAWHRRSQLPEVAGLLARAQREIVEPVTPAAMCAWAAEAQRRLGLALDEALPAAAELMLTIRPEQLRHLERRFRKNEDEMREEFLQPDPAERRAESFERTLKRFENLYGRLDAPQRELLARQSAASSFDAERWLAERRLRQRDVLQALATLSSAARTGDDRDALLLQARSAAQALAAQATRSPRADYRAHQERLMQENCALAAAVHNATSRAQREAARARLKGWEDDLRLLAAAPGTRLGGAAAADSR